MDSVAPTPPGGPLECELGFGAGTPERRAPSAARGAASEPEWAGARRARAVRRAGAGERPGHVWQRRGGFGARGFKKVWRGAGAFPGLAEGRRAEAAAAHPGSDRSAPGVRSPAPRSRGPKKLWEQRSPAELPGGARRPRPRPLYSVRRLLAFSPSGYSVPAPPKLNERAALGARGCGGGGMERSSWAPRTFLLALVLGATLRARAAVGYYPRFSPFFFLCTHHGELEGDGEQGEVLISLHIAGHPTYYVPGQEYHGRYLSISALTGQRSFVPLSFFPGAI